MKKNVILLGGSNSIMQNGLQKGLRDAIETGGGGLDFYNFALGANDSLHKIFAIVKNEEKFYDAELIIIETNVNDYDMLYYAIDFENIALYINILFKKLSCFKSKILFLILPFMARETGDKDYIERRNIIENFLRQKINHFGFNCIDMQTYYNKFDILPFFTQIDRVHQPEGIMRILGKTIIKNMHKFHFHTHKEETKSKFLIATAPELFKEKLESKKLENSILNETIYKLDSDTKLKFSEKFKNFQLMGVSLCSFFENNKGMTVTSFILENKEKKIIKMTRVESPNWYLFHSLNDSFIIDENSFMYFNKENLARSEGAYLIKKEDILQNNIKHCGLSYFFLAQINEDDKKFKLYDEVKLLKELDFSYLTPPVEIYKELIELYLSHMRNAEVKMFQTKLQALQQENSSLKNNLSSQEHKEKNLKLQGLELKLKSKENKITKQVLKNKILEKELGFTHKDILENKILNQKVKELEKLLSSIQSPQVNIYTSAKLRVQNHLAYKLGQALILNSKSLKGYIRMPYVLSYIKDKHKAEQKAYNEKILKNPSLKLPSLDSYPDYEAALKEKECLTYRLGEALMKANKEWYKGGYIKFYFESKRLRKEFKKRKLVR